MEAQDHSAEDRMGRVEGALDRLAAAQARTDEHVRDLAAAQARTEGQVRDLAAAQVRTEERVGRLEGAIDRLTEAQARTEQRLDRLAEAQARTEEEIRGLAAAQRETIAAVAELAKGLDDLRKQVGGLSETVGGDIEDIAYIVLHDVLKREFGWDVGVLERIWKTWNGQTQEVNIFGQATDPIRPAQTIWILGEAKHNLTVKDVKLFVEVLEHARRNLTGEIFPVCFCCRARPEVVTAVQRAGLRLVYSYGKLV